MFSWTPDCTHLQLCECEDIWLRQEGSLCLCGPHGVLRGLGYCLCILCQCAPYYSNFILDHETWRLSQTCAMNIQVTGFSVFCTIVFKQHRSFLSKQDSSSLYFLKIQLAFFSESLPCLQKKKNIPINQCPQVLGPLSLILLLLWSTAGAKYSQALILYF